MIFAFEEKTPYLWWDETHTFCVNICFMYIVGFFKNCIPYWYLQILELIGFLFQFQNEPSEMFSLLKIILHLLC